MSSLSIFPIRTESHFVVCSIGPSVRPSNIYRSKNKFYIYLFILEKHSLLLFWILGLFIFENVPQSHVIVICFSNYFFHWSPFAKFVLKPFQYSSRHIMYKILWRYLKMQQCFLKLTSYILDFFFVMHSCEDYLLLVNLGFKPPSSLAGFIAMEFIFYLINLN